MGHTEVLMDTYRHLMPISTHLFIYLLLIIFIALYAAFYPVALTSPCTQGILYMCIHELDLHY